MLARSRRACRKVFRLPLSLRVSRAAPFYSPLLTDAALPRPRVRYTMDELADAAVPAVAKKFDPEDVGVLSVTMPSCRNFTLA